MNLEPRSGSAPIVSIIVPCRNERDYIAPCLQSILASRYPADELEVVVVDGLSDDGTREIISEFARRFANVRMITNDHKVTPVALNLGIAASRGSIIIRMDAHNRYGPEYVARLVEWLEASGADNVGGACVTRPANETAVARGIAAALSHPAGVGNALFRLGVNEPRWVDTVPFGCYRRDVFDRIGLFDEALLRNQDDEFNARLRRHGGKILLVPDVTSEYFARGSLGKLWLMYYQYGFYKPLAISKAGARPTLRSMVPPAFVGLLGVLTAGSFLFSGLRLPLAVFVMCYGITLLAVGAANLRRLGIQGAVAMAAAMMVLHVAYGSGYLSGLRLLLRHGGENREISLSR